MKYFNHYDEVRKHFDSLAVGTLVFCFGRTECGKAYSNLAYYRIFKKIDSGHACLSIEVETDDPNEPDDRRHWHFHPMQVYPVEGLE